jgi:8-oxo-dGTP diphosphatase
MTDRPATVLGPFVGVSAVVVRDGLVLVGRRRGSHGAGTWAFPGGTVDAGEEPADTVRRELLEETGLRASAVGPIAWTSDVMADEGLHFVTLHHRVEVDVGDPQGLEPEKVEEWRWVDWSAIARPMFAPAASLLATGWRPGPGGMAKGN